MGVVESIKIAFFQISWFNHLNCMYCPIGCDNSDRNKQLKQVFKNAQSLKKV